jgi:hypothetical protein
MLVLYSASSASPGFLSGGLNPTGDLASKTEIVLLDGPPGRERMQVFRGSGSVPGALSVENYSINADGRGWDLVGKEPRQAHFCAASPGRLGSGPAWSGNRHLDMATPEKQRLAVLLKLPRGHKTKNKKA